MRLRGAVGSDDSVAHRHMRDRCARLDLGIFALVVLTSNRLLAMGPDGQFLAKLGPQL